MSDKIMTLHPDKGKRGVNISRATYDLMRDAIVSLLAERDEQTFTELRAAVAEHLQGRFDGSVSWYYTTVKLDLEARGIIERTGRRSPQKIRLVVKHR